MTEPRKEVVLENRRWSKFTTILIILLILAGLAMLVSYMWDGEPDPDRPPIIISTGSVIVDSGGDWVDEGGDNSGANPNAGPALARTEETGAGRNNEENQKGSSQGSRFLAQ